MPTVATICAYLDRFAPPELAAEWDNVGLLLGNSESEVQRIITCLTIAPEVVAEAIENGVQLIIAHHPILFRGTKKLTTHDSEGRQIWPLARAGIAVYSPHTAFDNCVGGINDIIARRLGLVDVKPLRLGFRQPHKIIVFMPESDLQRVSDAMFEAGAGKIGQYGQCSFRISGTGTFFASDSTNPTVGIRGRREEVSEWRLEVVCPEASVSNVLKAMRKAHSYEEPAFDVYPLRQIITGSHEGRVGDLKTPTTLEELAQLVKKELGASVVQIVKAGSDKVDQLAIACGAAGEFLDDAWRAGADVFLTGEVRFHDYLKAREMGINVILPGHYATERPAVEELAEKLAKEWPGLKVWASKRETDPVTWVRTLGPTEVK